VVRDRSIGNGGGEGGDQRRRPPPRGGAVRPLGSARPRRRVAAAPARALQGTNHRSSLNSHGAILRSPSLPPFLPSFGCLCFAAGCRRGWLMCVPRGCDGTLLVILPPLLRSGIPSTPQEAERRDDGFERRAFLLTLRCQRLNTRKSFRVRDPVQRGERL
jgi:hypothetical protein